MSKLHGVFSLRTPKDLLEKLDSDFDRFRSATPAGKSAQYAAFDFFVTAQHLPDWLLHAEERGDDTRAEKKAYLDAKRTYPNGELVSHVAIGIKHFRVDDPDQKTVKDTRSTRGFVTL